MRLTVLVGRSVSPAKLERLRALETSRVTVELVGNDTDDAEIEARRRDDANHAIYIPPYNDPEVVAGQATVGVEILEDWPDVDTIVVPIGGGGLIAGIGLWAKAMKPGLRLVGVQPAASPPMYAHFETGSTDAMPIAPTLADGVAGNIERDSITWKLCRQLVDEVVLVDEDAIGDAMRWALEVPHILLEGSAVLGIAALRAGLVTAEGRNVAIVATGRNLSPDVLRSVLG
jgi:threonine dehydratase